MNIFAPQSIETQFELEEIADLKLQIISPQSSTPIIAMKQDQLLGVYNLTSENYKIDWRSAMNLLAVADIDLQENNIPKNKEYTGKEIYSYLIPNKINISSNTKNGMVVVKNGIVEEGILAEDSLGAKKSNSLVKLVWDEYGVEITQRFLDNTTRLINNYNMFNGFSVGIKDLAIPDELQDKMQLIIDTKKLEIEHEISEIENNPDILNGDLFEKIVNQKLTVIRDDVSKIFENSISSKNNFRVMESSGSKGKMINLTQMIGLVGQQDFKQNRILKNFNERTLPYYFKNDDRADARGFIGRSFSKGLNLQQFIFHHLTSREGLIDQTVRTAESGYIQRKLIKSTEDFMVSYDCTVRNAVGRIQQFIYGDSGADTVKQYAYRFNMIEMSNSDIINKYKFTKEEMKQVKNFSDKDNNDYVNLLMEMRDNLRRTQIKATLNNVTIESKYMLPININHIIINIINDKEYITSKDNKSIDDVEYILNTISRILDNQNTKLLAMTKQEMLNPNSVKSKDDKIAKTALKYALYEALSPKICIIKHRMNKKQLEKIAEDMIKNFNKSIVEPGEMVGIIGAQSLGEPVTQLMLNAFHSSGIGGKGGTNIGVDRIKEVFSLSKNPKQPYMYIYLDNKNQSKKDFANKIASHIKFTTIKDLRSNIEIFYDPMPYDKGGFMEKDNVYNIFQSYQVNKQCCLNSIDGLPWLMRIEFDKEKLLNKEVTLLDIKSQFCFTWEKRYQDIKSLKREKKQIIEKVTQLSILSNTDNDNTPVIHLRFDLQNFNSSTLVDFMDMFVDDFKLKGMPDINDIMDDKAIEERYLSFDNENKALEKKNRIHDYY